MYWKRRAEEKNRKKTNALDWDKPESSPDMAWTFEFNWDNRVQLHLSCLWLARTNQYVYLYKLLLCAKQMDIHKVE